MNERYLLRLKDALNCGSFQACMDLSNEIHGAEENGYEVSPREDRHWAMLTEKIQKLQAKGKHK